MDKSELMKYLIDLHKVYIELKENKEAIISNELNEQILKVGESYYTQNENNLLYSMKAIQFLLEYTVELANDSSNGNYSIPRLNEIILKGEKLCLDLENKSNQI